MLTYVTHVNQQVWTTTFVGTDLDRMTVKFRPREPVIKNSKWPTI